MIDIIGVPLKAGKYSNINAFNIISTTVELKTRLFHFRILVKRATVFPVPQGSRGATEPRETQESLEIMAYPGQQVRLELRGQREIPDHLARPGCQTGNSVPGRT